jgi:RpiB/LacA/LacB family sugar-phosphate isomerase
MESFFDSFDQCEKIFLASDHAGYSLKEQIKLFLTDSKIPYEDLGPFSSEEKVDHPDFAEKVCKNVTKQNTYKGILVCGSGVGICVSANKIKGIRCGLCYDYNSAISAKTKDYCNVIALGGRIIGLEVAKMIVEIFIHKKVERHLTYWERLKKVHALEDQN